MVSILGSSKKAMGVFGGGLVILCSFLLMWSAVSKEVVTGDTVSQAAARAIDIDTSKPDPTDNGKLVVAAGELQSLEQLEDEFLKPGPYLVLSRRVEMFQWGESLDREGGAPTYAMGWYDDQKDFFSFAVPEGHENPLMQVKPEKLQVNQSSFGRFDGTQVVAHVKKLRPLQLSPDLLKEPTQEIVDNKIVIRRNGVGASSALGDMRISYEALSKGPYTVMAVQEDERSLLSASPGSVLVIQEGLLTTDDFLRGVKRESDQSSQGALFMGGGLLFFGLISLLSPLRDKFDLRPHMNVQGSLAVLVVSAGLSVVVMLAFTILGFLQ
jgi:hypothetical protein